MINLNAIETRYYDSTIMTEKEIRKEIIEDIIDSEK